MLAKFDIFRVEEGGVLWLECAQDFETARQRVQELGKNVPGEYLIFDHRRGLRTPLFAPEDAPNTRVSSRSPSAVAAAEAILTAAMELVQADFGNVQVADWRSNSLQIVAQRGLSRRFLDFFQKLPAGGAACGTAFQRGERVIIKDVATDPIYSQELREVMLAEGIRSLQSIPLIANGRPIGVMSQQYRKRDTPSEVHLRISDSIAGEFATRVAQAFAL